MKRLTEDVVFRAVADGTRRRILDGLSNNPKTTGQVIESFPELSRCAVMKHLDILVEADLVHVRRDGKFRWNYINPTPLGMIYNQWLSRHVIGLAKSMNDLKRHVEQSTNPIKESR